MKITSPNNINDGKNRLSFDHQPIVEPNQIVLKTPNHPKHPKIAYNDFSIRLFATFLAAYIVTEYGGNEPLLPRLLTIEFYLEFGTSFLITFILIEYIYRITVYLDRRHPWDIRLPQRIILQILIGILLPSLLAYLMAAIYFALLGANITDTNYHLYALPFIASLITLFNGYYLIRFLFIKMQTSENDLISINNNYQFTSYANGNGDTALHQSHAGVALSDTDIQEESAPVIGEREVFIVNTLLQTIPLRMEDVCSFYRSSGINYVRTYDQTVNDAYIISQSLKEVEEQISSAQFFRINRQMIISFKSCISFRNGKGKSLELTVHPPHVDGEDGMKELPYVTVSEDRAKQFRIWIER